MKKTIGYTRVSTAEQAADGVSLGVQAKKIDAYCTVKDWQLSEVISDEGESAKSLNRPGVARLIEMVEIGEVATVIIYKLDRLTCSVTRPALKFGCACTSGTRAAISSISS